MKLEAGKFYKTREGKKVLIFGESPFSKSAHCLYIGVMEGNISSSWSAAGRYYDGDDDAAYDLVSEWKELKSGTHWLNVYLSKGGVPQVWYANYKTRLLANYSAENYKDSDERIACIEVPWVEGQGVEAGK